MAERAARRWLLALGMALAVASCDGTTEPQLNEALVAVTAGAAHTCGLTAGGRAFCWGWNRDGQLGTGATDDAAVPAAVRGDLTFAAISAGGGHTCGLTPTNKAYCWGFNQNGQLGTGSVAAVSEPAAVSGDVSFAALSAGGSYTCGLNSSGQAFCWGWNGDGQLGDGTTTDRLSPVPVSGGLTFTSVSAGAFHTCGVATDGQAYCWGRNPSGELGNNVVTSATEPVLVSGGLTFASIDVGFQHTCGITTGGDGYCWGSDDFGQLGNGTGGGGGSTPTSIVDGASFASISAGAAYACGVYTSGEAWCWGFNQSGQLGSNVADTCVDEEGFLLACSQVPFEVTGGLGFASVTAGSQHTCGVTHDDLAYCWGRGSLGQLGNGSTGDNVLSVEPVRVAGYP